MLVVLVAVLIAGGMVLLGRWQLQVDDEQGAGSRRKGGRPPVPLGEAALAGSAVTSGLGRSVTFTGRYEPGLQSNPDCSATTELHIPAAVAHIRPGTPSTFARIRPLPSVPRRARR